MIITNAKVSNIKELSSVGRLTAVDLNIPYTAKESTALTANSIKKAPNALNILGNKSYIPLVETRYAAKEITV